MRLLKRFFVMVLVLGLPAQAWAAGFFLAPRGVRPLAMAGAYIAGAEAVDAASYNPAGLAAGSASMQLDAALPRQSMTFVRAGTTAPVTATGLNLPSPTLGVVHGLGILPGLRFGAALAADIPQIPNWPSVIENRTTPQRYAGGTYTGTALSKMIVGAGYQVAPWLRLGASVNALVGNFAATATVSTCDGVLCTQPENPDYDATLEVRARGLVIPGLQLGVQMEPWDWLVVGLAWESGYTLDSEATLRVRLPSAAAYAHATLDPQTPRGRLRMALPQHLRAGVQLKPHSALSLEVAYVGEPWRVHDAIVVQTGDAVLRNMLALGDYTLGGMRIAQGFRDTYSVRLGGDAAVPLGDGAVHLRAGALYEPSAIPNGMLTPRVVDLNKGLAAVGVSLRQGAWQVEGTYAHVFMFERTVTKSRVYQLNPTQSSTASLTTVGNGRYNGSANIFGLGLQRDL